MKLYVLCPQGLVTGGAEALHQLVHHARNLGQDANICYYDRSEQVTEAYRHYNVAVTRVPLDSSDAAVVVAETHPEGLAGINRARRVVWWLSVDNYFAAREPEASPPYDDTSDFLAGLCHPSKQIIHLAQSEYARQFLLRREVRPRMLTDYLSAPFLARAAGAQQQPKKDVVLYNPKKGLAFTERLIDASKGVLEWVPIQGLSADGVAELLAESKLYVDFGEHPGRDRIPREAAISGCCVITGTRGAAGNDIDIPIPRRFVLDEDMPDVVQRFIELSMDTMRRFDEVSAEFASYRETIANQEKLFAEEVAAFVAAMSRPLLKGAPIGRYRGKKRRKR